MRLDLRFEPFSRFGSYLAVGWEDADGRLSPPLGSGWYIRSHHARAVIRRELFLVQGLVNGGVVELEGQADPALMTLRHAGGAGTIEISFDTAGNLRLRGVGMGMRLEVPRGEGVVSYSEAPGLISVNARLATRRYQIEVLSGSAELVTDWAGVSSGETCIDIAPDASETFELAVDEFWSTWVKPAHRAPFSDVRNGAATEFEHFRDRIGTRPESPELATAWDRAAYTCWSTVVRPEGQLTRPTMYMSKNWMDQVWSWDNCFNAQAFARGHEQLAWDQWFVVFDHQDAFGAIPDGLNDVFKHYNFCKPPVHGWTLRELINRTPTPVGDDTLEQAYRYLARHTRWFLTHRRQAGDLLPYYLHGNDSGWDNATMFDNGVPLVAPDLAALLVAQTEVLSEIAAQLKVAEDDSDGGSAHWRAESDALFTGLMQLWDGERFVPRRIVPGRERDPVATRSLIPCLPIFLGRRLPESVRSRLIASIRSLVTEYGVATEPLDSPQYESDGYWRGPVWGPSTYLIVEGLRASGEEALADDISNRFCHACVQSGFAENFDAVTGQGLRDRAYSWTASVFLLLQGA